MDVEFEQQLVAAERHAASNTNQPDGVSKVSVQEMSTSALFDQSEEAKLKSVQKMDVAHDDQLQVFALRQQA